MVPATSGIICENFGIVRYLRVRCAGVWHAVCYTKHNDNNFPKMGRDDIDDLLMGLNDLELDNPYRFQVARNGDHMMLPFQCDISHLMNIYKRVPHESSHQDWLMRLAISCVNLDSFCSRESSTVLANFREEKRETKIKMMFGMEDRIFPNKDFFLWKISGE